MKTDPSTIPGYNLLEKFSKVIAMLVNVGLMAAAVIIIYKVFADLNTLNLDKAIQDGLFVLILLEMFYVIKSFIKYGSINVGLVVNVGLIAATKELMFKFDSLDLQMAGAFGIVFVTLGFVYFMETLHHEKKPKNH